MTAPKSLANAALALTLGEAAKARPLTRWERKKLTETLADGETVVVLLGQSIVRLKNEEER